MLNEVFGNWVKAHSRSNYDIRYSYDKEDVYIRIYMLDGKEKWYYTDVSNPRFTEDVAKVLKETHGDRAYLYALERVVSESSSKQEVSLWKAVLTLLEKEK